MAKIPKNLSDKLMFEGVQEKQTFETMFMEEETVPVPRPKKEKESLEAGFLTKELAEKIGRALLEMKLDLYKEGMVEYTIKVAREGKTVVLSPQPVKKKKS